MYRRICSGALALTFVSHCYSRSPLRPRRISTRPSQARSGSANVLPTKRDQVDPLLQKYDFGGQLRVLQDPTAMDPGKTARSRAARWKSRNRWKGPKGISTTDGCASQSNSA